MEMKSFFIFSVVLLLVSFSVIHINHANGADFINYIVNPARKLLDLPDIGDDAGDGIGNIGDGNFFGGGDGDGTGGFIGNVGDGNGGDGNSTGGDGSENRIGEGTCSNNFIQVNQGPSASLPSGIPTYTVIVLNACYSGSCSISNIHLSCGWFSSARLINPRIFRRLNYNDCLVNDGQPLAAGESLTFSYANTYPYKLAVSSIVC
ncbi:TPD1 protein homolog 1-like [Solanum lycopersicum]|uniref:TPD1 protein homolog 1-like n=1 Tax=Solanum lycopersicum TaxID=4081 RepID=UPI000276A100|nr:TPD1 protein homolog 1-like [Solanum lycopersicum]